MNFSSESVKTKEHKENNSYQKCDFSINAFYKIDFEGFISKVLVFFIFGFQKNFDGQFWTFSVKGSVKKDNKCS